MNFKNLKRATAIALAVLLFAPPAEANVAVPLFAMTWFGMVVALIPIVIVETLILWEWVGLSILRSAGVVTSANLASAFVGIPIAWFVLWLYRSEEKIDYAGKLRWRKFFAVASDLLWLYETPHPPHPGNKKLLEWAGWAAGLVLLIAFFASSWLSEFWVASLLVDDVPLHVLNNGVFVSNLVSYGILTTLVVGMIGMSWRGGAFDSSHESGPHGDQQQEPLMVKGGATRLASRRWHGANKQAKRGIGRLKAAESRIARKGLILIQNQAWEANNAEGADKFHDETSEGKALHAKRSVAGG